MAEACERRIYEGSRDVSGHACGRPAVDSIVESGISRRRCKFHKGVDERAAKRHENWRVRFAEERRGWDRVRELGARFEALGIVPVSFRHSPAIHFDIEGAEKILAALGGEE